ncbi:MAG: orotidine 5'-phosphate decarboxylase [Candidatus Diapherotrites archaeon]|nr:orotidine 5'-phosphate decarboxylase [Candidatus Diapherotrites archaeon]
MEEIIPLKRSVIPALDVKSLTDLNEIIEGTHDVEGIGGYKVGFSLGLKHGLDSTMSVIRKITDKPVIYDHQKAGTDIPDTGKVFMDVCSDVDIDAVILFPQSGPNTQTAWTEAAKERGLKVIIGGEMTHPGYLEGEDGYIRNEAPDKIYARAVDEGVTNFVVPGNRIPRMEHYRDLIKETGLENPTFFSPGLVAQGGVISEGAKAMGDLSWHAIVGRAITGAEDKHAAAEELTKNLEDS